MKTQAVRLDDATVRLVEALAKERRCTPSDVIRAAISAHLTESARKSATFAAIQKQERDAYRVGAEQRLVAAVGELPDPTSTDEVVK